MHYNGGWHCFILPSMPMSDRQIILDVGELLANTDGAYRQHMERELRLLRDAAGLAPYVYGSARGRVIPFRRGQQRGA